MEFSLFVLAVLVSHRLKLTLIWNQIHLQYPMKAQHHLKEQLNPVIKTCGFFSHWHHSQLDDSHSLPLIKLLWKINVPSNPCE